MIKTIIRIVLSAVFMGTYAVGLEYVLDTLAGELVSPSEYIKVLASVSGAFCLLFGLVVWAVTRLD